MAEDMREIAELPPRPWSRRFGEQADVVAGVEQPIEQRMRFAVPADQRAVVDKPEAARKKYTFVWRQPVLSGHGVVPAYEAVHTEASPNGPSSTATADVGLRQEAGESALTTPDNKCIDPQP